MTCLMPFLSLACAAPAPSNAATARFDILTGLHGPFAGEAREDGPPLVLVSDGHVAAGFHITGGDDAVVRTGCEVVQRLVSAHTGAVIPLLDEGRQRPSASVSIYALVGEDAPGLERLQRAGFTTVPEVGPQGFVIGRVALDGGVALAVWSPTALGCRYGLIELARSLEFGGGTCSTRVSRIVSRPVFPFRAYYLNFAEHLQNRHNVNVVFDQPECRWSLDEWKRLIDMIAAMRFSVFEFWLVPTLFSPEALEGGELQAGFARTMRAVIDYAHEQGLMVEVLQAVNTVGAEWRYYCPSIPEEREMILSLWDHWTRELSNADIIGLFPGDPGGCTENGCDHRTFVDLCLDIVDRTRGNGNFIYEVNTWGTPFWGWGLPSWEGTLERVLAAFDYFIRRLPEFPQETFVGLCMGLNPEAAGDGIGFGPGPGGDTRAYAEEISRIRPVTTWDYGASEGEMTVIPRFRVAKIIQRRQTEATWPYVGGINYTMSPALNQLQPFAAAECYWNPERTVEELVESYSRLAFGPANAGLGAQVFPYTEVVGDWGGGGWHGSTAELATHLAEAREALGHAAIPPETPLLVFPSPEHALANLKWHVELLAELAEAGAAIEVARELTAEHSGLVAAEATLREAQRVSAALTASEDRDRLREALIVIRRADLPGLKQRYFSHVYGLYAQVDKPVDPRAWGAADALFARFGEGFVTDRRQGE